MENASDRTLALVAARGAGTDEPAECPPLRTRGGEPDVPSSVRKDRHVPGTSGLSIRSFTAGVAGDTSASAPILACVWSFSAGAPSEAISPDAPDGCGSRTSSPEVHPPARGNPGATPALSPTEARARSRRLARGFLTPDPIKRRATKGSDWGGDSRASAATPPKCAVCMERSLPFIFDPFSSVFSKIRMFITSVDALRNRDVARDASARAFYRPYVILQTHRTSLFLHAGPSSRSNALVATYARLSY